MNPELPQIQQADRRRMSSSSETIQRSFVEFAGGSILAEIIFKPALAIAFLGGVDVTAALEFKRQRRNSDDNHEEILY